MMRKYFIKTYGCQMNVLDSQQMGRLMQRHGFVATNLAEEANLILINTCSVREKPHQKLYSDIGRYRSLKMKKPDLLLGVAGCQAEAEGLHLKKKFPYLDFVLGPDHTSILPKILNDQLFLKNETAYTGFTKPHDYRFLNLLPDENEDQIKAFVTIMKGCDNFCSFCIVPYVRGREVCRSAGEIVAEVRQLAEMGTKEVTLLGQNVNSYGMGRHQLNESKDLKRPQVISFAKLLRRISKETEIQRIRFTTSHPKDLPDELLQEFHENSKLARQFHLPVQSGSNEVLGRMYRGYTRETFLKQIEAFRKVDPEISFSTDIIVGFPGETDGDFEQTLELLQEVRFDSIYSFVYSSRPKTTAALYFQDDLSPKVKKERLKKLQGLQAEITLENNRLKEGNLLKVLVEGPSKQGNTFCGRSSQNHMVHFRGAEEDVGKILPIRITQGSAHSLRGVKL